MDTNLIASNRETAGKGGARKTRGAGKLPAVMYGPGFEPRSLSLDPVAFSTIFRKTQNPNTVLHLDIEGENVTALVREVQRHPLSREILHVDLLHVDESREVVVPVRVEAVGRPAGAALGGRVRIIRRTLDVRCTFDKIPETLQIDVSPMDIGDMRKASDVVLPEGVALIVESDINIVSVYGKRGGAKS